MTLLRITGCSDYEEVAYQLFQHLGGLDARNEQRQLQKRRRNKPKHESPVIIVERVYSPSVEEVTEVIMTAADLKKKSQSKGRSVDSKKLLQLRKRLMRFVSPDFEGNKTPRKPNRRGSSKVGASDESIGLVIDGKSLAHALTLCM
ncbi:hypothetical protein AHF37_12211 [Paragonimus kellicotti]|nr:hypothetical protein AHF37_12211 [Paragonimus kellicotti]